MPDVELPSAGGLVSSVLRAIEARGGVATNKQIEEFVITDLSLSPEQVAAPHGRWGGRSELSYRIAWARTRLRKAGRIVNRSKGVWAVTRA